MCNHNLAGAIHIICIFKVPFAVCTSRWLALHRVPTHFVFLTFVFILLSLITCIFLSLSLSWKRKIFLNKMKLSFNLLTNCTCFVCVPKCTWNNKKSYVCVGILPIGRLENWIEKRNKNEHEIFSKINDLVIYDENERFDWESVHHTPSFQ